MEVIDLHLVAGYNLDMDIYEIRLIRLRELEKEAGGRSSLADKLGMAYSLLSSYIGKNPTKRIGEKTARNAEEIFNKPRGWMDALEDDLPPIGKVAETRRANLDRLIAELAQGNTTAFGRLCGKSQSLLSDLLADRKSFGEKQARSIEDAINLDPGWLSTPQPERITFRQPSLSAAADKAEDGYTRYSIDDVIDGPYCPTPNRRRDERRDGDRRSDVIELRRLNVSGSMGAGDFLPGAERSVGTVSVDAAWLRQNVSCTSVSNLALLDGRGDSMAGTYSDGDILVVDRGVQNADIDAIYVLQNGDELYIKRLQRLGSNRFMMISDNKAYIAREITLGDGSDYRVLARVVGLWNWKKL